MVKAIWVLAILTVLGPSPASWGQASTATGQLYSQYCAKCHESHEGTSHISDRRVLGQMAPESIYEALVTGRMAGAAKGLSDSQKRELAEYLSGRPLGTGTSGDASKMKNHCAAEPLGNPFSGPMWNGWGADLTNARFQPAASAGLTAQDLPHLRLKWAFGFPNAGAAWGQPTVVGGRVYVGSQNGFVYALSAASGCVYWSFRANGGVRSAITMGPPIKGSSPAQYPLYFGDVKANVYSIDAASGKLLWTRLADPNPSARITAAPQLHDERLYVPVASWEATARGPDYECCKFRGSVVAYDANTGEEIWKAYTIRDEPRPTKKTANGVQQWGPSGGGVWGSPTIDVKRNVIYVGTGDAYTSPAVDTVDAVLAFDLTTGKLLWSHQLSEGDVGDTANAPDFDIGASVILRKLPKDREALIVSQKSGVIYALDPDNRGTQLWAHRTGEGSRRGGTMWGSAADDKIVYVPNVDTQLGPKKAGGLYALRLDTGEEVWHVMPPVPACEVKDEACAPGQSAAVTLIPGAVFSGSTNGVMRAYSTADGQVLWQSSARGERLPTVNGVEASGGSLNGPGPTVVGGMVFMNSGYGLNGGTPGNVLLAFGVEE